MAQQTALRLAFRQGKEKRYSKGEVVVRPGECDYVYLVKVGFVKAYTISSQGFCNLLAIQGPNNLIPVHWAAEYYKPELFYEAMADTTVSSLSCERFWMVIRRVPELYEVIFRQAVAITELYSERIHNLELRTSAERIVFRLLYLAREFGRPIAPDRVLIMAPMNYQDIADSLNMTRETANRELSALLKEGILERRGQQLVIRSMRALSEKLDP